MSEFHGVRHRAFIAEAQAAGVHVLDAISHAVGDGTDIHVYYCSAPELGPFMFVKPFRGDHELPGEFHAMLPGGMWQPICLAMRTFGAKWATNDDDTVASRLKADRDLAAAVHRFKWVQHGARGDTRLVWGVQMHTLPGGGSHLIMQSATYGSGALAEHGIDVFLAIAGALAPMLTADAPPHDPYFPATYSDLFLRELPELAKLAA